MTLREATNAELETIWKKAEYVLDSSGDPRLAAPLVQAGQLIEELLRRAAERMPMFAIGAPVWSGLSKLDEECGEALQVIGKLMGTGGDEWHWDGSNLRLRLIEEIGDVMAACDYVCEKNNLDVSERRAVKLALFRKWHREALPEEPETPAQSIESSEAQWPLLMAQLRAVAPKDLCVEFEAVGVSIERELRRRHGKICELAAARDKESARYTELQTFHSALIDRLTARPNDKEAQESAVGKVDRLMKEVFARAEEAERQRDLIREQLNQLQTRVIESGVPELLDP